MTSVISRKLYIFLLVASLFLFGCSQSGDTVKTDQTGEQAEKFSVITAEELKTKLDDKDFVIVDIRDEAAYIGWALDGLERGGHIRGAVDFPYPWLKKMNKQTLTDTLKTKGITADKNIVIYDVDKGNSEAMAGALKELGYKNIYIYKGGASEWAKNKDLPMESLPNYSKLVHPAWVNDLINGKNPETYPGKGYKLFEVSWGQGEDYKKGHIPGAVHINTDEVESEPLWNRLSDKELEKMLLNNGITHDTTVVLYSADTTPAARVALIMMYMGVEDVRILNGGFEAWKNAGFEIETGSNPKKPVTDFGKPTPAHPEYIIDMPEAKELLKDPNGCLVSIRSWAEQIGETSGYSYIKPKGRIPGDVWGHDIKDYRNIDQTMRNAAEIQAFWKEWGITPDKKIAFYCGTGWRAAEVWFYAYVMGWPNISVYDGGWYEWSSDKNNPIETGEQKPPM
ncbi:rhodanese-like domain-containing protein [Zhaonella formicivorans]|uniref:rhodanese-like domain-containing protein n=1 Tax=Zhaonella formicivorans TaxID=2528593 RepID=UPI0010D81145|nr:rhodanese-like domain-containing protein [Zhaonella formicivorans]